MQDDMHATPLWAELYFCKSWTIFNLFEITTLTTGHVMLHQNKIRKIDWIGYVQFKKIITETTFSIAVLWLIAFDSLLLTSEKSKQTKQAHSNICFVFGFFFFFFAIMCIMTSRVLIKQANEKILLCILSPLLSYFKKILNPKWKGTVWRVIYTSYRYIRTLTFFFFLMYCQNGSWNEK